MKISFSLLLVGLFLQTMSISSFGQAADVEIVLYEQTSRMGALGNFFGGMITKDRSGQTVIDPFGLSKAKNKKVCYVLTAGASISDDEFIANNLKKSLGKDKSLYAAVGSEDIRLNVYPDFNMLGQGMISNQCEYIVVADYEMPKINETIKLTDSKTEKTYKRVDDFKVSSNKLWSNSAPGEPLSRQEYLASKRCVSGEGKLCKKDPSELILEHLKASKIVVNASEPTKCIFDVRTKFVSQTDGGQDWISFNSQRRYSFNNVNDVRIEQTINTKGGSADAKVRTIAKENPYSLIFVSRNSSIVYIETSWREAISPQAAQLVRIGKMDIPSTEERTYGQFFFTTLDDAQRYKDIVVDLAKECSANR